MGDTDAGAASDGRRLVIAGGSGFLGQGLIQHLREPAQQIVVLSRKPAPAVLPRRVVWQRWDAKTLGDWVKVLDGADALVNFVGRTVDCRKTPANKREILNSRVDSVRVLGQALAELNKKGADLPRVWVQAGTAHIYGDPIPEDTQIQDDGPIGTGLAPEVGLAWETAFRQALPEQMRGVVLRTSFVLGRHGGALQKMARLTRWGLGGRIGSGKQWISWIHEDDFHRLVCRMIQEPKHHGVYNVTAPEPVTNEIFMRALRQACHRPWSPPAPEWGVRLAPRWLMNTDPELALLGRRVVPSRLLDEQAFEFEYPQINEALSNLLPRT